jgi:hypothetical protein
MNQQSVHTEQRDGFDITLYTLPEYNDPDYWDFDSDDNKQELLDKIKKGELLWFCAKVNASKNGIVLGTVYLGGCCYSIEEFISSESYSDMVKEAIENAKSAIRSLCSENSSC